MVASIPKPASGMSSVGSINVKRISAEPRWAVVNLDFGRIGFFSRRISENTVRVSHWVVGERSHLESKGFGFGNKEHLARRQTGHVAIDVGGGDAERGLIAISSALLIQGDASIRGDGDRACRVAEVA